MKNCRRRHLGFRFLFFSPTTHTTKHLTLSDSPDGDALRLQIIPALIHFIQPTLQHNRIFLWGEWTQQFAAGAIEPIINDTMSFNFRL